LNPDRRRPPRHRRGGEHAVPDPDQPRGQPAAPRGPNRAQRAAREGDFSNEAQYLGGLRAAVADVVARQCDTGIDLVNDGEFGYLNGMKV
jgi:hypothetical protein